MLQLFESSPVVWIIQTMSTGLSTVDPSAVRAVRADDAYEVLSQVHDGVLQRDLEIGAGRADGLQVP